MAFNKKYLRALGDNATAGVSPVMWSYFNAGSDTVTTAGFVPSNVGVHAKDIVAVIPAAGNDLDWYYTTESSGVLTLAAVS